MAPIVFNWRHLAVVTSTTQFHEHFIQDLKKLAYFSTDFVRHLF
jgi:hypothetical protein